MLECKMPQGQQSGDEQSPSPKNNSNNHISAFANSRLFSNSTRQFNSTLLNTSDQNQNFFSSNIGAAHSNGISSASNSNGFQINGNKKLFLSSSKAIISAKAILETPDDPESSNHKNNSKTTATQSRNFEDHMLDSLKDTTSYSLNLTTSKGISGFQNNFSNVRSDIQNFTLKTTKNNIPCENSLNNFSSSLFFDNSNMNNNNNNNNASNNKNNNNTCDFNANENYQGNKVVQNIQINSDFSSPTYNQNSFNQFNSLKNKSVKSNTNILVGNSNNTQKWVDQSTSKLILNSSLYPQQMLSINNQEDDEGEVFNNESLSQLWTKPSVLQALTKKNLQVSEQNLLINGSLKQQLNKNLLGESSFHKKSSNNTTTEQAFTPSTMSHLNSNVNLNNSTNYLDDDDKGERSSRGLRNLSLKVKQIVVQKGQTSYKEVADQLVDELKSQSMGQMKPEDIQKDEQNIKRRVYDALNVLIASKVIEKSGKVVKSCEKSHLNGRCLQADNWKNVKLVESERDKKKETLLQKQKILTEYAAKYLALMSLMERNKKIEQEKMNVQCSQQSVDFLNNQDQVQDLSQRMNTIKDQISLKDKILTDLQPSNGQGPIFKFPLVLISVPTPENDSSKVIVKMSRDQKNGKFFSQSKMIVHADLDVLLEMKMHQVDQQFASKYLNQEFISKYLVGNTFFQPQSDQSNESSDSNFKRGNSVEQLDNQFENDIQVEDVKSFIPQDNYQTNDPSIKQTKKAKASAFKKPQAPKNKTAKNSKKADKSNDFDNEIELD